MNVRPFLVTGTGRLEKLHRHLMADVHRWADTWLGAAAAQEIGGSIAVPPADGEVVPQVHLHRSRADASWAIVGGLPEAVGQLGCLLVEPGAGQGLHSKQNELLEDVVRSALNDLVCHLLRAAADDEYHVVRTGAFEDLVPGEARLPGAGILQLDIEFPACRLPVWLPLQSVSALHAEENPPAGEEHTAIVPLDSAVSRQRVHAEVVLGLAEVSVGALARLRIGDVIELDKSLNEPLCLRFRESPSRFAVWLGRRSRHLAVCIDDVMDSDLPVGMQ